MVPEHNVETMAGLEPVIGALQFEEVQVSVGVTVPVEVI